MAKISIKKMQRFPEFVVVENDPFSVPVEVTDGFQEYCKGVVAEFEEIQKQLEAFYDKGIEQSRKKSSAAVP